MQTNLALARRVSSLQIGLKRALATLEANPALASRLLAISWAVTRSILLVGLVVSHSYCDPQFYNYAGQFAVGHLPYRDLPKVEYPPLTMVLLLLPAIPLLPFAGIAPRPDAAFPATTHLPQPNPVRYGAYGVSFAVEMLVIDALTLWLVRRAARRLVQDDPIGLRAGFLYVLLVFLCGALLQKFDVVMGTLCLAAVVALIERKPGWAWAAVALATLVKGYPILALPVLAGYELRQARARGVLEALRERARPLLTGAAWFAGVITVATLTVALLAGWQPIVTTVLYHADRGTEIESLYANVVLALGWLPGFHVRTQFSPADLSRVVHVGPQAPLAGWGEPAYIVLLGLCLLAAFVAVWRTLRWRAMSKIAPLENAQMVLVGIAAVLLAFLLAFRALPAHYLLVIIPLAPLIRLPTRRAQPLWIACVAGVAVLGQVVAEPAVWESLKAFSWWAVLLLSLRNIAWVIAFCALLVALWQWTPKARPVAGGE